MAHYYSEPDRDQQEYDLPDIETFERDGGWWWWTRYPRCGPDTDPVGPFASEAAALADARIPVGD
jgi:hypothetical protein